MIAKQIFSHNIGVFMIPYKEELTKFVTNNRDTVWDILRNVGQTYSMGSISSPYEKLLSTIKGIPYVYLDGDKDETLHISFFPFLLEENVFTFHFHFHQTTYMYNVISGTLLIEGKERPCDEIRFRMFPSNGQVIAKYDLSK